VICLEVMRPMIWPKGRDFHETTVNRIPLNTAKAQLASSVEEKTIRKDYSKIGKEVATSTT
jgi:hypothetical protein